MAEQITWCLYSEGLGKDRITDSEYQALILKLVRKFKDRTLYFVIDGLHQIPDEDKAVISQIFADLLPTGSPKCRFVISGLQSQLGKYVHGSAKSRYYHLHKFSIDECKTYLSESGIDQAECEKVYELCKGGSPGRLAVVRRLLIAGTTLSDILERDPTKYLEFVKLEFDCLKSISEQERLLVTRSLSRGYW